MGYVLQITNTTGGGAGRAAVRLHQGLLDIGVDSRILCRENPSEIEGVHTIKDTVARTDGGSEALAKWNKIERKIVSSNRTSISNTLFSLGYPGYDLCNLPLVQNADILHLHWTPRILSTRGVENLLRLGKPTFWTQHDRWPTTAGYHFQASESDFADLSGPTTHLFHDYDLAGQLLEDKRNSFNYANLHIVCLTENLTKLYREKSIFSERQISTIPNGIETDTFKPFDDETRHRARRQLGIDDATIVFLLLSQNGKEKRKGYAHLAEALRATDAMPSLANARDEGRILVATVGAGGSEGTFLGLPSVPFASISDDEKLTTIMNASDALIMPSEQESFSLAILEAMSCGLPVITFGHGGMPEKEVRTGENGILIDGPPSPKRLAEAIDLFCSSSFDRKKCRAGARRTAEQFDLESVASQMHEIYRTVSSIEKSTAREVTLTSPRLPQIEHAVPFDYAPSDWLARQPAEAAIAMLFATPDQPATAAPVMQTSPSANVTSIKQDAAEEKSAPAANQSKSPVNAQKIPTPPPATANTAAAKQSPAKKPVKRKSRHLASLNKKIRASRAYNRARGTRAFNLARRVKRALYG